MFTNQLNSSSGQVILSGQVIGCVQMTPQFYSITFSDNFENVEFWWHHDITIGIYVEVLGTYTLKEYKELTFHKIFAKKIKLFESSNQLMLCYLETLADQQLYKDEINKKEIEKENNNNYRSCVAAQHSLELTTCIVNKCIKKLGTKFLQNQERKDKIIVDFKGDSFENIIASEQEKSISIQMLNYVGILDGINVINQEITDIISFAKSLLQKHQSLTISFCTKKLNELYSFKNIEMFTDDISVCLFNLFLLNYICLQDSQNTIIWKQ